MQLKLKKLEFENFKGGKESIAFNESTSIHGANRAGKTRTFDAWLWLLFGKDSKGKSDFEIKPLNVNGEVMANSDVEVSAKLEVDGQSLKLMKVYKEKWVKKKGTVTAELTGHTTTHYLHDVNVSKKEFEDKIKSIADFELFRMLTNPEYFESLKWQDKRAIIFSLAPSISDEEIAEGSVEFTELLNDLSGVAIATYKQSCATKRKRLNDELKLIPSSIAELEKVKPVIENKEEIEMQLYNFNLDLKEVNKSISNEAEALNKLNESRLKASQEINKLKVEAQEYKFKLLSEKNKEKNELESKISEAFNSLTSTQSALKAKYSELEILNSDVGKQEVELNKLRGKYDTELKIEFKMQEGSDCCPTCKQQLPVDDLAATRTKLLESFNATKESNLAAINESGVRLKALLKSNKDNSELLVKKIDELEIEVKRLIKLHSELVDSKGADKEVSDEFVLSKDVGYISLNSKIESLVNNMPKKAESESDLLVQKSELEESISKINKELNKSEQIAITDKRISELQGKSISLAQSIADIERKEHLIHQFTKKKIEAIEEAVNAKFEFVKFKLYNQLLNGGEEECCITLIDGVPYASANTESRVNSGLDIIKTFSDYHNTQLPIFIDNRESVTNIINLDNQVINLVVDSDCKSLTIV